MSTLGERLSELRGRESRENAAKRLGVHENTLFKYEKDQREPGVDFLTKVCGRYAVNLDWLLEGRGPKFNTPGLSDPGERFRQGEGAPEMVLVPMLDVRASAGFGQISENEAVIAHVPLPRQYLLMHGIRPESARMAISEGDSMVPDIGDGDPIVLDIADTQPRDKTFMFRRGDQLLIKKLQRKSDGTIMLLSSNPAYAPEVLPRDEADSLVIIGRVGMVLRSL